MLNSRLDSSRSTPNGLFSGFTVEPNLRIIIMGVESVLSILSVTSPSRDTVRHARDIETLDGQLLFHGLVLEKGNRDADRQERLLKKRNVCTHISCSLSLSSYSI